MAIKDTELLKIGKFFDEASRLHGEKESTPSPRKNEIGSGSGSGFGFDSEFVQPQLFNTNAPENTATENTATAANFNIENATMASTPTSTHDPFAGMCFMHNFSQLTRLPPSEASKEMTNVFLQHARAVTRNKRRIEHRDHEDNRAMAHQRRKLLVEQRHDDRKMAWELHADRRLLSAERHKCASTDLAIKQVEYQCALLKLQHLSQHVNGASSATATPSTPSMDIDSPAPEHTFYNP